MLDSKEAIERVLGALGERLEFAQAPPIELAVCGGAALHVRGLMTRGVTRDVDAFAVVRRRGRRLSLEKAEPLPDFLLKEAAVVAKDFGLPTAWLNSEPTSIVDLALPQGLVKRLHPVKYGKRLTIHYLDRLDQVHFKLQAAADNSPASRHFVDLVALKPTRTELETAVRWAVSQDPSDGFRVELRSCLAQLGHEELADGL